MNKTSHGKPKAQAAQPIKNISDIKKIKEYFLSRNQYRNHMLFTFGINIGLKSCDLLQLKVSDVFDGCIVMKTLHFSKQTTCFSIPINNDAKNSIELYLSSLVDIDPNEYLFKSRKHGYHITKESAWEILNRAIKELGLNIHIGTESLRKTFNYAFYKSQRNEFDGLYKIREQKIDLDYLDIEQTEYELLIVELASYYNSETESKRRTLVEKET